LKTACDLAHDYLLTPNDIDAHILSNVLDRLLGHQIDHADLYFQYQRLQGFALEEGIVKSGSYSIDEGVGIRAVAGEKTAFAYSDAISEKALFQAADVVREIARKGEDRCVALALEKPAATLLYGLEDPIASLADTEKIRILHRLEAMARAKDPRVTQVMAQLAASWEVVHIVSSQGARVSDIRPLVRLSLTVILEENGRREQGSAGGGGRFNLTDLTESRLQQYVDHAIHQAQVNLEAKPAPAGEMTVVLGSGWPGILLHEAIGHGLEGDFNRKGSSAFAGRLGQRVAAPGVTVVDDGTLPSRRGSLNVDDEGTPTQCTTLIEDGILKAYLQDTLNARLMGTASTGNGRRESFAHLPMPRMTNTYMLNGQTPRDEIIASVKKGLYAANFGGGQVDITSGKFVFSASEAYLIEDGKITTPVKGATLIGNGPDVLTRVSLVGNDMELDPGVGTCGKEGQSVPVGVGQPTLRIDGLTVGGTA
jgi:TldD protein